VSTLPPESLSRFTGMRIARCADFPELMVAEESPHGAYDGMMAMIERMWWEKVDRGEEPPGAGSQGVSAR